jgi:protein SCO1/2
MKSLGRALLVLFLLAASPASAGLTAQQIASVGITPPPNAAVPLGLGFRDDAGRSRTLGSALAAPADILVLVDYTCRTLCGMSLAATAAGLRDAGLAPGTNYRLVVVGIDPKDGAADAAAMRKAELGGLPRIDAAATFLRGDAASVDALTAALGYRAVYDAANDQYAHPTAALVLTHDGRLSRVMPALALDGANLRLALVEAARGRLGTLADHIRLLCYGFDPVTGFYGPAILVALKAGGAATLIALGAGLWFLSRRRRPEATS